MIAQHKTMINQLLCFVLVFAPCLAMRNLRSIQLNMYLTTTFETCQRYLTRKNVSGCASNSQGHRGRLLDLRSIDNFTGHRHSSSSWIVLIPPEKDLLEFAIAETPSIVGILIDGTLTSDKDTVVSEVGQCPDDPQCQVRKNPRGIDFRALKIDKPIFLLTNETTVEELRNLSSTHNEPNSGDGKFIDVQ